MTKGQIKDVQLDHPREYELVMADLYDMPLSYLVTEMVRWMPKSEFMKLINQMKDKDEPSPIEEDEPSLIEYAQERL